MSRCMNVKKRKSSTNGNHSSSELDDDECVVTTTNIKQRRFTIRNPISFSDSDADEDWSSPPSCQQPIKTTASSSSSPPPVQSFTLHTANGHQREQVYRVFRAEHIPSGSCHMDIVHAMSDDLLVTVIKWLNGTLRTNHHMHRELFVALDKQFATHPFTMAAHRVLTAYCTRIETINRMAQVHSALDYTIQDALLCVSRRLHPDPRIDPTLGLRDLAWPASRRQALINQLRQATESVRILRSKRNWSWVTNKMAWDMVKKWRPTWWLDESDMELQTIRTIWHNTFYGAEMILQVLWGDMTSKERDAFCTELMYRHFYMQPQRGLMWSARHLHVTSVLSASSNRLEFLQPKDDNSSFRSRHLTVRARLSITRLDRPRLMLPPTILGGDPTCDLVLAAVERVEHFLSIAALDGMQHHVLRWRVYLSVDRTGQLEMHIVASSHRARTILAHESRVLTRSEADRYHQQQFPLCDTFLYDSVAYRWWHPRRHPMHLHPPDDVGSDYSILTSYYRDDDPEWSGKTHKTSHLPQTFVASRLDARGRQTREMLVMALKYIKDLANIVYDYHWDIPLYASQMFLPIPRNPQWSNVTVDKWMQWDAVEPCYFTIRFPTETLEDQIEKQEQSERDSTSCPDEY